MVGVLRCCIGPSPGFFLVLASQLTYESEASCWLTLEFYVNVEHFTGTVIPTPGFFLVLASRLMYENKAYRPTVGRSPAPPWSPSFVFTLLLLEGWPSALYNLWPLIRPVFAVGGRLRSRSLFSLPSPFSSFSPRAYRSPTASLGPRTTFKSRMVPSGQFFSSFVAAPLLVRLLLRASFPVPSLSCFSFPIRDGLYCGWSTVLQGSCQSLVLWGSAGLSPYDVLTVPLLCPVPSCCRHSFHPFLCWVVRVVL